MLRILLLIPVVGLFSGCAPSADNTSRKPADEVDTEPAAEGGQHNAGQAEKQVPHRDWRAEYEQMNAALELSDEEQVRLQAAFEAREEEHATWMAAHGAELRQLEEKMMAAAKSRDLGGVRSAKAKATPLRNELRELLNRHEDFVTAALSDENQLAWAAALLADRLLELMTPLDLTKEQRSQIQAQAAVAAQQSAGEPNPPAAGFVSLEKKVEATILTAAQKEAYAAVKKKYPMRSLN